MDLESQLAGNCTEYQAVGYQIAGAMLVDEPRIAGILMVEPTAAAVV